MNSYSVMLEYNYGKMTNLKHILFLLYI